MNSEDALKVPTADLIFKANRSVLATRDNLRAQCFIGDIL